MRRTVGVSLFAGLLLILSPIVGGAADTSTTTTTPTEKETGSDTSMASPDEISPATTHPSNEQGKPTVKEPDRIGVQFRHTDATGRNIVRRFYDLKTGDLLGVLQPGAVVDIAALKANLRMGLERGVVDPGDEFESVFVPSGAVAAQANLNMAQSVFLTDITDSTTYNVDMDIYVYERGCSDPDTCPGGQPASSGYVWFMATQVVLGDLANDDDYGMHLGMAKGGIAQLSNWYADWSGYVSSTGAALPNDPTGWNKVLDDGRWYTLRIWRLACNYGDCGWGAWVIDKQTGQELYAGSYYLNANTIANASSFSEIIETDPCSTDILGVHMYNRRNRNASGIQSFAHGVVGYQPVCNNTDIRRAWGDYTIDDRMVFPRTNPDGTQIW